jgi:hypothetical protein
MLANIDAQYLPEALTILKWLLLAKRPLTLSEIAEAAIIQSASRSFDPEARLIDASEVWRICGSLIIRSQEIAYTSPGRDSTHVRFAHYSVQQFLLSGRAARFHLDFIASRNQITSSCLLYLEHVKKKPRAQSQEYLLLCYAAAYWFRHWEKTEEFDALALELMCGLFGDRFSLFSPKWLDVMEPCTNEGMSSAKTCSGKTHYPGPLYYAVHHDLIHVAMHLIRSRTPVNDLHSVGNYRSRVAPGRTAQSRPYQESMHVSYFKAERHCILLY